MKKKIVLAGLLLAMSVSFTGCGPAFFEGDMHANHSAHMDHSN